MKIVINRCYGGFGLSDEAAKLYLEKKMIQENLTDFKLVSIKGLFDINYSIVKNEYNPTSNSCMQEIPDGDKFEFWDFDLDRTDAILVEVVEELGDKANDNYSELEVVDIPSGTRYRIDEYDGIEHIEYEDSIDWTVAT